MGDRTGSTATRGGLRKHLGADALIAALHPCFEAVKDPSKGQPQISLHDVLMSAFAMFSLKDPSLLQFERRRMAEEHNLRSIYHVKNFPCDTQVRERLDEIHPDSVRSAYKTVFRSAQRGKVLEQMVFMEDCYLVSVDGTGYFSSTKLKSPACLEKKCSKTGKTVYHLQALGAAMVHPDCKEVIPLPPEFICKQDGQTKNDSERNACKRWLHKFRKDHPHLKVIITEDALSPNAPHIRDLKASGCHFILGFKDDDHKYLSRCLDEAVANGQTVEHAVMDPKREGVGHFFRFANGLPLNGSNKDVLVNVLEYWQSQDGRDKTFSWVTDFTLSRDNVYQIMRGGRARWKVENETFNTLKNQGYHLEHNYGLGEKHLSMVFFSLMMLAFLVDQLQQISCPLFRELRRKTGSKRDLWEKIRATFHIFLVDNMETIYRILLAGPQKIRPVFINDTS